ncbi:MAG: formylglycine-generating enzyme family protein [Acidobacteriota bacterium]
MRRGTSEGLVGWPVRRMLLAGAVLGAGMGGIFLSGMGVLPGLLACGALLLAAVSLGLYRPLYESLDAAPPPPPAAPLIEMVDIPVGEFLMGSSEVDQWTRRNEQPQHPVSISAFQAAAVPVTRGIYRQVMESVPEQWADEDDAQQADLSATHVSWFDALEFCNRLSRHSDLQPCYEVEGQQVNWDRAADGYRLPTEAEWEYAARAGSRSVWFFGDDPDELKDYAWFRSNSDEKLHPVRQLKPNPWGLFDVYGNVWEWCFDAYSPYKEITGLADPVVEEKGRAAAGRVLRGGSWSNDPDDVRSAIRGRVEPEGRYENIGFRCVRGPRRQP